MDIAALSTSMAMSDINTQISTKVLDMGIDDMKDMGNSMVKMMENSVTPYIGGNIDLRI